MSACKYVDGLPLYRIERVLQRSEVELPRATLASRMGKAGELVQPLLNLLRNKILDGDIFACDLKTEESLPN